MRLSDYISRPLKDLFKTSEFKSALRSKTIGKEEVDTYAAMTASISSDSTTKRDFFVSADETNGGGKASYRYDGVSVTKVGGGGSTAFTALSGTAWDGSNKYTTLTANTALTLNAGTNTSGILHVIQDATGSRTLTINGLSFLINTAANSITGIGYYVANGQINFTMDKTLVAYTPDVTAPTVVSITATDLHTIQVVNSEAVGGTTAGWSFKRNGAAVVPTGVSGTTTRSFTFAETFLNTDTFLASYDATTGDTMDVAGNEIASFAEGAKTVTNSIVGTDADVAAWATAAGITDNTYKGYVNTFVLALKSAGIFSTHFDFIHILCGGSDTKCKFNLINPADTDAAYRLTFLNAPSFAATGVTTNGTNQYINSHWIGGLSAKATSDDYHISAYQRTAAGVDGTLWGFDETAAAQTIYTFPKAASGTGNYRDLDIAQISFTPATAKGLWISNKTATTGTLHQDGAIRANGADNANGQHLGTVQKLTFNAYNSNGTMVTFHAAEICILSAGRSLNSTQRAAYESAVSQLVTSLGL